MAKLIQRIGTAPVQFSYDITVKAVAIELPGAIRTYLVLQRGPKIVEGKLRLVLDKTNTVARFNETLSISATLYRLPNKDGYLEKKAKVGVYTKSPKGVVKVLGECEFDLALFAGASKSEARLFKLQRCYDKNGHIELEIRATPSGRPPVEISDKERSPAAPSIKLPKAMACLKAESAPRKPLALAPPVRVQHAENNGNEEQKREDMPKELSPQRSVVVPRRCPNTGDNLIPDEGFAGKSVSSSTVVRLSPNRAGGFARTPTKKDEILRSSSSNSRFVPDESLKGKSADELRRMVEDLEREKEKSGRQARVCEKDLQEQIRQNIMEREEKDNTVRQMEETIRRLESTNADLVDKCGVLEKSLAQEIQASSQMGQEIRAINEKLSQLLKQKLELDQQLSQTTGELTKANIRCEATTKEKNALLASMNAVETDLGKIVAEKDGLTKALESLRKKLKDWLDDQSVRFRNLIG